MTSESDMNAVQCVGDYREDGLGKLRTGFLSQSAITRRMTRTFPEATDKIPSMNAEVITPLQV